MTEQEFVQYIGPLARQDMKESGILASITAAQACLESGYGSTELAQNASNYFGMKCALSGNTWKSVWDGASKYTQKTNEQRPDGTVYTVTADFRKYPDIQTSIRDHSCYLMGAMNGNRKRFDGICGEADYRRAAEIIKAGGYATDIDYVDKLCSLIERWNLTQYDKEGGMEINREYVTENNTYAGNQPKYIVIHETDNFSPGANARKHAQAQAAGNLSTSIHYYSGDDGVYQAADHSRGTWSVGKEYGGNHSIRDASNLNTINIEICVNSDGVYSVARQNAIELVKYLIKTTGIPAERVIRHYDAKGKYCPRKMMDNPELWEDFKNQIKGGSTVSWKGIGIKSIREDGVAVYETSAGTKRIATLSVANTVEVDGTTEGGFTHVAVPSMGLYGYIDTSKLVDYVDPKSFKAVGVMKAKANDVNIRYTPGGEIIGQLPEGGMVEISGKTESGWRQVRTADHLTIGWMQDNLKEIS